MNYSTQSLVTKDAGSVMVRIIQFSAETSYHTWSHNRYGLNNNYNQSMKNQWFLGFDASEGSDFRTKESQV